MLKAILVLAYLTTFSPHVQAQDTLPLDVVLRLFPSVSGSEISRDDIFVGRLPPAVARLLPLPPKTRVVGGIDQGSFGVSAALDSDLSPQAVATYYREQLQARGYRRNPTPVQNGIFVDKAQLGSNFEGCRQGIVFSGSATRQGNKTHVWLGTYELPPSDTCNQYYTGAPSEDSQPPMSLVPPLVNPEGSMTRSGGQSGGGSGSFTADQELETTLSVAEVLQHYAKQLTAANWQAVATKAANPALHVFQTTAPAGARYTIVLSARQEGEGYVSVFLGGG